MSDLYGCDSCDRVVPSASMRGPPDEYRGCGRCTIRCGACCHLDEQCARCRAEADEAEREALEEAA